MRGILNPMILVGLLVSLVYAQATMPPWQAADTIRRNLSRIELLWMIEDAEPRAALALQDALRVYKGSLHPTLSKDLPELDRRILNGFNTLSQALEEGDAKRIAATRQWIWTSLLEAGMLQTLHAVQQGQVEKALSWIAVREYPRNSLDTGAETALEALRKGQLQIEEAADLVRKDLLLTYAAQLHHALARAQEAAESGLLVRAASWTARARGMASILADNMKARLGRTYAEALAEAEALALSGQVEALLERLTVLRKAIAGYVPTALPRERREQLASIALRYVHLIALDYPRGVRNGTIFNRIEYQEAVVFHKRAQEVVAELRGELSPRGAQRLGILFTELEALIHEQGPVSEVIRRSREAVRILQDELGINPKQDPRAALKVLQESLQELLWYVKQGDYEAAELKRLEAYAFFDPDMELHLMPRAPTLSLELESLFWEGTNQWLGLQRLLQQKASAEEVQMTLNAIKERLAHARTLIEARPNASASFSQAFVIIFREGLEAVMVIFVLLSAMKVMGTARYGRYLWAGVALGILSSLGLWYASNRFVEMLAPQRELLEGVTALVAAAILVYVTHWIFHRTYVVQWVTYAKAQVTASTRSGHAGAILLLGFFIVFREGLETVLFYQALLMQAEPLWVGMGFLGGLAGTLVVAWLLIIAGTQLPVKQFFGFTGALLMLIAFVFAGHGVRGLQTAGVVSVTPLHGFVEAAWLQLYLGIYPTLETTAAQGALVVLYLVGFAWLYRSAQHRNQETGRMKA